MPRIAVLADLGSAYVKAVAVSLDTPRIVARAACPSTQDVADAFESCIAALEAGGEFTPADVSLRLACSSAHGALRLAVVGLSPATARLSALGTGARIVGSWAGPLAPSDVAAMETLRPDAVLLAGGTDGGETGVVIGNAAALARADLRGPVILAGSAAARDAVYDLLDRGRKQCYVTGNVEPEAGRLDLATVRGAVGSVFAERVAEAEGLDRVMGLVDAEIVPTPSALVEAANLLSQGAAGQPGIGDLMVVDVGGSMTTVVSVSFARPVRGLVPRGAPEPFAKRTVEGDLGVQAGAASVAESPDLAVLRPDLAAALQAAKAQDRDSLLASACVDLAVERHVEHVVEVPGARGPVRELHGKDLRGVKTLIGIGGAFSHGPDPRAALRSALARPVLPGSLRPESPALLTDGGAGFAMLGMLAARAPRATLALLRQSLLPQGP